MNVNEKDKSYESKRFPIDKKHLYTVEDDYRVEKNKKHDKDEQVCVEEILEAILKAQRKVEEDHKRNCSCSSCKESIEDLLKEPKKPRKNTIPFILLCGCEPFKGTGVTTYPGGGSKDKKLACISSFIFKIKNLKGQCAELELLSFKPKKDDDTKGFSPCDQIDHEKVEDLVSTGVCINVDLSCFCGVTCLPAVRL
ncbi:CotY/CotZ family spore coat protein [Niallia sp. Krafla_26]|uniref:CotY/CotZ family spore coat protein n=1 Tax=Niallia sp. Krafla_26 TaxID=3064703 RepID=UPI003D173B4C